MQEPDEYEPNHRLRMLLSTAALLVIGGAWLGVLAFPRESLDVPTTIEHGHESIAYLPVSPTFTTVTVVAVPILFAIGLHAAAHSEDVTLDRHEDDRINDGIDRV